MRDRRRARPCFAAAGACCCRAARTPRPTHASLPSRRHGAGAPVLGRRWSSASRTRSPAVATSARIRCHSLLRSELTIDHRRGPAPTASFSAGRRTSRFRSRIPNGRYSSKRRCWTCVWSGGLWLLHSASGWRSRLASRSRAPQRIRASMVISSSRTANTRATSRWSKSTARSTTCRASSRAQAPTATSWWSASSRRLRTT